MPGVSLLDRIACWPWAEAATILFGFAWGAMLGSFLNVVVYRLPRGESVVSRRSSCPRCGIGIRPLDNVPVFGWLRLGGRCRDCGGRIAVTYPLVEAFCGLVVATLAAADLLGGGRWLTRLAAGGPAGIDRLLRGDWQLLLAFGLHAGVVLTIICWSLLDGVREPGSAWQSRQFARRSLLVAAGLVIAVVAVVPAVGPPGLLPAGSDEPAWSARGSALAAALAGLVAGGLAAAVAGIACRPSLAAGCGLPLAGSVLGWQAVTVVAIVTIAACRGCRRDRPALPGLVLAVLLTAAIACQEPLRAAFAAAAVTAGRP
jgi:leader peptidase (prepilin peptidase) / N-methyltransferase